MKLKFRLYQRKTGGRYYAQDNITGQQQSLGTTKRVEALRLLCAPNEADYQLAFNGHLARTYLSAGDPEIAKRSWQWVSRGGLSGTICLTGVGPREHGNSPGLRQEGEGGGAAIGGI